MFCDERIRKKRTTSSAPTTTTTGSGVVFLHQTAMLLVLILIVCFLPSSASLPPPSHQKRHQVSASSSSVDSSDSLLDNVVISTVNNSTSGSGSGQQRRPNFDRWKKPCAPADVETVEVNPPVEAATSRSTDWQAELGRSLGQLASRGNQLVKRIGQLKERYAKHRFHEDVSTLDQLGFQLEGMPKPPRRNKHSTKQLSASECRSTAEQMFSVASRDLSIVSAFVERAVHDEQTQELGQHYADEYRAILDHHEHGFYWILCELERTKTSIASTEPVSRRNPNRAGNNNGPPKPVKAPGRVQNNAIRHYRDYVVLRDLGKILDRLSKDSNELLKQFRQSTKV